MAKTKPDASIYGRSVPFRFERTLAPEYFRLRNWFAAKIWTHATGKGRLKQASRYEILDAVDCILANLIDAHRRSAECFVAISLREAAYTKSRYFQREFGYTNFRRVIDYMTAPNPPYLVHKIGFNDPKTKTGRVSRFMPSGRLLELLNGYIHLIVEGNRPVTANRNMDRVVEDAIAFSKQKPIVQIVVPLNPTTYHASSDCIRLKDSDKRFKRYRDTDETNQMRKELEGWNNFLVKNHHIDLLLPDAEVRNLFQQEDHDLEAFYRDEDETRFVEFERVRLHRVFNNGSFKEGGRFYGGWWQQIPSRYRKYVTINGRATCEYDYSGLHPTMLYADAGLPLAADQRQLRCALERIGNHLRQFLFEEIQRGHG